MEHDPEREIGHPLPGNSPVPSGFRRAKRRPIRVHQGSGRFPGFLPLAAPPPGTGRSPSACPLAEDRAAVCPSRVQPRAPPGIEPARARGGSVRLSYSVARTFEPRMARPRADRTGSRPSTPRCSRPRWMPSAGASGARRCPAPSRGSCGPHRLWDFSRPSDAGGRLGRRTPPGP